MLAPHGLAKFQILTSDSSISPSTEVHYEGPKFEAFGFFTIYYCLLYCFIFLACCKAQLVALAGRVVEWNRKLKVVHWTSIPPPPGSWAASSYTTSCDCNYSPIAPWSYTPQPLTPAPPFQTQLNSRTLQLKILFLKKGEVFKKLYGLDHYHTEA